MSLQAVSAIAAARRQVRSKVDCGLGAAVSGAAVPPWDLRVELASGENGFGGLVSPTQVELWSRWGMAIGVDRRYLVAAGGKFFPGSTLVENIPGEVGSSDRLVVENFSLSVTFWLWMPFPSATIFKKLANL